MSRLTCEVVQDLLPNYVEGLTQEETNRQIEEHIGECAECRSQLELMRTPHAPAVSEEDRKEIDFLKKAHKKSRKRVVAIVILCIIAALLIGFAGMIYFAFNGSVIKKHSINKKAVEYVNEKYSDRDYVVGNTVYDFKMNDYYTLVKSGSSQDDHFTVWIHEDGTASDTYEYDVLSMNNTVRRYESEIRDQLDARIEKAYPYKTRLLFVEFATCIPIDPSGFTLDMPVDVGHAPHPLELVLWTETHKDEPSYEELADILRETLRLTDSMGIDIEYFSIALESKYYVDEYDMLMPSDFTNECYSSCIPREIILSDELVEYLKAHAND